MHHIWFNRRTVGEQVPRVHTLAPDAFVVMADVDGNAVADLQILVTGEELLEGNFIL